MSKTTLIIPDQVGTITFAAIGDSITDQCSQSILPPDNYPARVWFTDGYLTWFRILTNQRIHFPIQNELGVSGNTLQQILARVDSVLTAAPDYCIVEGGTNNIPIDDFNTIKTTWLAIIDRIKGAGIVPVIIPVPPRTDGTLTANQVKTQMQFYNFQKEYCRHSRSVIFVDYLGYLADQASTTYAPLPNMLRADNIHPAATGAYWIGKALADMFAPLLNPVLNNAVPVTDAYDPIYNPTGTLIHNGSISYSTLAGTTGLTVPGTGLTYTSSNLATGFFFLRENATSVATVALTKENPRTDPGQASGERQVIDIHTTSVGNSDEVYSFRFDLTLADVNTDDWYYAEASVEVVEAPVNVNTLELIMIETRPANSQAAGDGYFSGTISRLFPSEVWKGRFRTPPIKRTSTATFIQAMIRARLKTDAGNASIKFKIADMVVRKIDPAFT